MTTAEAMLCEILGCGKDDIVPLFESLWDNELIDIELCISEGCLSADGIWISAIETAVRKVFGDDVEHSIYFNFLDSHVSIGREEAEKIEDFAEKQDKFEALTGFALDVE